MTPAIAEETVNTTLRRVKENLVTEEEWILEMK